MEKHWSVSVNVGANNILNIGENYLSGWDDVMDYADTIKGCAEHLLSFIGRESETTTELRAEVLRLTALCDGYRGEVAVLKAEEEKTRAYWSSAYYRMEAKCEELQSALTHARAGYEEFEKAKAHISGDRLGSYTLYGQWTLTADLTQEEIANHHYRTAIERGRAEGMEAGAVIAERYLLTMGHIAMAGYTAAAIRERAAKGEQSNKGESDDTAALREKHRDMWGY